MAPQTPQRSARPGKAGARLYLTRRAFLGGIGAAVAGCATTSGPVGPLDLAPRLTPLVADRSRAPYLPHGASFFDHVNRVGVGSAGGASVAGIDYAPLPSSIETLICPPARGLVIGQRDAHTVSGMTLMIAHGLGWKTEYGHLESRFVGYGSGWVNRQDIIAVMGASGLGATRGGMGPVRHLHLNLWAPAYTPLFSRVHTQDWPNAPAGFRHLMDAEELSTAGKSTLLPFSRPGDVQYDDAFLTVHAEAVRFADELLDRLDDDEARTVKARDRWERETRFDYQIDQRLWHVWQRLASGRHPFSADDAGQHRARLVEFMLSTPRLTAPIVEAARRADYRSVRATPLAIYKGRAGF